jgi:hypothetical protein
MIIYTLPGGQVVHSSDQFQIGTQKYPPGWLSTASAADIAAAGITSSIVADPPPPPPQAPTSVQVVSTSTPALSATYGFDAISQAKMMAVTDYILQNGKFPAGMTSLPYPDASGNMHLFTVAQFQALATVLADYVTALTLGQTPATPLTIP